ncbi:hypothetical protein RFI_18562 [Reticulomyxa filosa]|uniref:Uncharacterized protein n=1 Tax=Reticulomyxa filosa TaxID=46433 RepID=X6N043_RETFI|nr:hypothetical protein RFI_18562 [Reticulomyxa filosa]|eukprot:ETO18692.1 hypothetical protein RFI_18562 [Reticulomyxa filosa]
MNHLYFHLWKRKIEKNEEDITLYAIPSIPIYFGFGKYMPLKFHTNRWKCHLLHHQKDLGCVYKEYKAGHWVMTDCAQEFTQDIQKWIATVNKYKQT